MVNVDINELASSYKKTQILMLYELIKRHNIHIEFYKMTNNSDKNLYSQKNKMSLEDIQNFKTSWD